MFGKTDARFAIEFFEAAYPNAQWTRSLMTVGLVCEEHPVRLQYSNLN
jgi:hypothetical protein